MWAASVGTLSKGRLVPRCIVCVLLYCLISQCMIDSVVGAKLRAAHDPRISGSEVVPRIAVEHSSILGSIWNNKTGECVSLQYCSDRCEAYVLNVVRGISSRRHTDGKLDLFLSSAKTKKKIAHDHFVCTHGCCMRSNANYYLCAGRCDKSVKIEEHTTRWREFHLCSMGCQMRCGPERMDLKAPSEGRCDEELLNVHTESTPKTGFPNVKKALSKVSYDNSPS